MVYFAIKFSFSDGYPEEVDGMEDAAEKAAAIDEFLQEEWEGYAEGLLRAMKRVFKNESRK